MDRADIANNLIEIDRKEDFENREWTSLLRMKEVGIKFGTAKNEPFTGRQRRHINQHRTGTISHSLGIKEDISTSIEWELLVILL
jgi:hypothetical protein